MGSSKQTNQRKSSTRSRKTEEGLDGKLYDGKGCLTIVGLFTRVKMNGPGANLRGRRYNPWNAGLGASTLAACCKVKY